MGGSITSIVYSYVGSVGNLYRSWVQPFVMLTIVCLLLSTRPEQGYYISIVAMTNDFTFSIVSGQFFMDNINVQIPRDLKVLFISGMLKVYTRALFDRIIAMVLPMICTLRLAHVYTIQQ